MGIFNAFVWNSRFVFKKKGQDRKYVLIKTYVAYGLTYVMNMVCLWVLVEYLGIPTTIAPIIVICFVTPINFAINKVWVHKG